MLGKNPKETTVKRQQKDLLYYALAPILWVLLRIEKMFYLVRDAIWAYPDLFLGDNKYRSSVINAYKVGAPYSHMALALFVFLIGFGVLFTGAYNRIVAFRQNVLIEGVVMGEDSFGRAQQINKVDPFAPVTVQLEKDLVELIYEPLIKSEQAINSDGVGIAAVRPILADEVLELRSGADYQFNLRKGVKWHDGYPFTADDVIRTMDIISQLRNTDNAYTVALKQMRWEKLSEYSIRVCTKGSADATTCANTKDNPILANFLELISIKIVPDHITSNLDPANYDLVVHQILRSPVGTGRYKFQTANDDSITVVRNDEYYLKEKIPTIKSIRFEYFRTFAEAAQALQNATIHSLAAVTVQNKREFDQFPYITTSLSPVLYNQYWGMYFNLRKDPTGNSIAPAFLQDKKVRQAISSAINREEIIQRALLGTGEEAFGPINSKSYFFNSKANWYTYNRDRAIKLLEEAGWKLEQGQTVRTNSEGGKLSFSLYFLDSYDRQNIAEIIRQNLSDIGVEVITNRRYQPNQDRSEDGPTGWSLDELTNQVLVPRSYDALIFGMNTFIDPDRYELFHSSQSEYPKLNIASYASTEQSTRVRENRKADEPSLEKIPKVDKILDLARSFDPDNAREDRKKEYDDFQVLLADDSPVTFLYNPRFIHYHNTNLKNVDLTGVSSLEDRFRDIERWTIEN